jgi:hypothetical protein
MYYLIGNFYVLQAIMLKILSKTTLRIMTLGITNNTQHNYTKNNDNQHNDTTR